MSKEKKQSLYDLTDELRSILFEAEEDDSIDIEERLDALEIEFADKFDRIAWLIEQDKGDNEVIDAEIKRLQARKKSNTNRMERLKNYLIQNMLMLEMPKFKTPTRSYSIRNNKRIVFDDEDTFMKDNPQFVKRQVVTKLDKQGVKDAYLKNGEVFDGAHIETNQSLTIR